MKNGIKKIVSAALAGPMCWAARRLLPAGTAMRRTLRSLCVSRGSGTGRRSTRSSPTERISWRKRTAQARRCTNTALTAVQQTQDRHGAVCLAADKNAIGYISLGSVNDTIRVLKVNGVAPLRGHCPLRAYKIQRPFVVMTHKGADADPRYGGFRESYLKSAAAKNAADAAGCITCPTPPSVPMRGAEAIPVVSFEMRRACPRAARSSCAAQPPWRNSSIAAARRHAAVYGVKPEDVRHPAGRLLRGGTQGGRE